MRKCQYGVLMTTCEREATMVRPRPFGSETWDVCQHHADILDRVRTSIEKNQELLNKLRDSDV